MLFTSWDAMADLIPLFVLLGLCAALLAMFVWCLYAIRRHQQEQRALHINHIERHQRWAEATEIQ